MTLPIIPLLAFLIGLLMYVLASNSKVVEIGRVLMWTGILVTLLNVASWHAITLR